MTETQTRLIYDDKIEKKFMSDHLESQYLIQNAIDILLQSITYKDTFVLIYFHFSSAK